MKRIVWMLILIVMLSGCGERIPDKGIPLDQFHQEPVYLSQEEVCPYGFEVEDVENDYVTLLAPLNTNSTEIQVYNVGDSSIECDLYMAPDQNNQIMTCTIEPQASGVFRNLSASFYYYVGLKPTGDSVDIIIQD